MFIWFYYLPPLSTASLYLNGLLGLDTKLTAAENPPCSMNTKLEPGIHIVGINAKHSKKKLTKSPESPSSPPQYLSHERLD